MGRKAHFAKSDFIRAALDLLSAQGLGGVTMAAIAKKTGAPIGSVYHRFASREVLLATLWVELITSFQSGFLAELKKGHAQKTALYTLHWVREHPNKARVFLLYRREQLMTGDWPENIKDSAEVLASELQEGVAHFTKQFLGKANKKNIARVVFCLIHIPSSVARECLEAGKPIPAFYDQFIMETCQAMLEPHQVGSWGAK